MYTRTKQFTFGTLRHAVVAIALVVGLGACSTDTDTLVFNTDSAPYLVLNAVTVGSTLTPTRSDAGSDMRSEDAFEALRPVMAFPADAVVMMLYACNDLRTVKEAYAKRNGTSEEWKTYSNTACTEEIKIRPNATAGESWENMVIAFHYYAKEVVDDKYWDVPDTIVGGKKYYYDILHTSAHTNPDNCLPGSSIASDGKVTANFRHQSALITLDNDDIHISGYGDDYNTISAIACGATPDDNYSFTPNNPAKDKWIGIMPEDHSVKSFTITLTNGDASADKTITVSLAEAVKMKTNTRYKLTLTLTRQGNTTLQCPDYAIRIRSCQPRQEVYNSSTIMN